MTKKEKTVHEAQRAAWNIAAVLIGLLLPTATVVLYFKLDHIGLPVGISAVLMLAVPAAAILLPFRLGIHISVKIKYWFSLAVGLFLPMMLAKPVLSFLGSWREYHMDFGGDELVLLIWELFYLLPLAVITYILGIKKRNNFIVSEIISENEPEDN